MDSAELCPEDFFSNTAHWYQQFEQLAAIQPWDDQSLHEQKDAVRQSLDALIVSAPFDQISGGIWQRFRPDKVQPANAPLLIKSMKHNAQWLALASLGCQVFFSAAARWLAEAQVRYLSSCLFSGAEKFSQDQRVHASAKYPVYIVDELCPDQALAQSQLEQTFNRLSEDEQKLICHLAQAGNKGRPDFPLTFVVSLKKAAQAANIEFKHAQILEHTALQALSEGLDGHEYWQPMTAAEFDAELEAEPETESSNNILWQLTGLLADYAAFSENTSLTEQLFGLTCDYLQSTDKTSGLNPSQIAAMCYLGQALLRNQPSQYVVLSDRIRQICSDKKLKERSQVDASNDAETVSRWLLADLDYGQIFKSMYGVNGIAGKENRGEINYQQLDVSAELRLKQWQQKYAHFQPRTWLLPALNEQSV